MATSDTANIGRITQVIGAVVDVQYLGSECRVRASLDDGSTILATVPSDGLGGVTVGSSVRLAWPRAAAFTVADTNTSEGGDQ